MKGFNHKITIQLAQNDFRDLLAWLRDNGHVLHETMKFGASDHKTGDSFVTQVVRFRDPNKAMMFKLAWGGK